MRKSLPDCKSVRNLLDMYLAAPVRDKKLFDEEELAPLRSRYIRARNQYKKKGTGKADYLSAKKEYKAAKEEFEETKAAWEAKQPETYLDFVAYDMVGYEKGEILHVSDIQRRYVKLQSAAFIPPTTREFDISGIPAIIDPASFRKHHRKLFDRLCDQMPYKVIGLEVLSVDQSGLNADSRIVYRVKEKK
jgi:hypothetical protein